ncbi:hypothetical protein BT96DRAFT_943443 [Gymnopus androsaceus JB14]|uniref:Uncharacterized protein n=1 Tax=Gymnopus androsaceus JB14 TaxID=1447944 RepID=A0A6A4H8G1_9AGAR|nr:hypothetical protein BT96DRAFT_943443 [Gymnopus androsaceus JB14]
MSDKSKGKQKQNTSPIETSWHETGEVVVKHWSSAYSFFGRDPDVEFNADGKAKFVVFNCTLCCVVVKQGASGTDAASTALTHYKGVLLLHARKCWGKETVDQVMAMDKKNH